MRDSVIICIPTFRRPKMLALLLDAIAALETDADVRVLVADKYMLDVETGWREGHREIYPLPSRLIAKKFLAEYEYLVKKIAQ